MERLKTFGIWLLIVIAFAIFSNVLIQIWLHPQEIGGAIYNMTHKETVNEVEK